MPFSHQNGIYAFRAHSDYGMTPLDSRFLAGRRPHRTDTVFRNDHPVLGFQVVLCHFRNLGLDQIGTLVAIKLLAALSKDSKLTKSSAVEFPHASFNEVVLVHISCDGQNWTSPHSRKRWHPRHTGMLLVNPVVVSMTIHSYTAR